MTERSPSERHSCSADGNRCAHCANEVHVDLDLPERSALRGAALVWSAIGSFLVPIVLAIVGAVTASSWGMAEVVGALIGLAVGMVGAIAVFRWIGPKQGSDA